MHFVNAKSCGRRQPSALPFLIRNFWLLSSSPKYNSHLLANAGVTKLKPREAMVISKIQTWIVRKGIRFEALYHITIV